MKILHAHQAEFQESRGRGWGDKIFAFQYWEINFNLSGIEMFWELIMFISTVLSKYGYKRLKHSHALFCD